MITLDMLKAACSAKEENAKKYFPFLGTVFPVFEINAPLRQAAFFAQVSIESAYLSATWENLNYSEKGLISTFPKEFNSKNALVYAHEMEKIANRAYAGKGGNGDEKSGDGWLYRGRGLMQITLKNNYAAMRDNLRTRLKDVPDFVLSPDSICEPKWSLMTAACYWYMHGCNAMADKNDFDGITRAINGSAMKGKDLRDHQFLIAKKAFGLI